VFSCYIPIEMHSHRRTDHARGLVVSDLHLFARRSHGADCIKALRPELASARVLVLNGDIFDFRWSTLEDVDTTALAAVDWLRELLNSFPQCEVHYVIGNHDCLRRFRERIAALARAESRLRCHEHGVRFGTLLFLHGDCAHRKMDPGGLRRYRSCWDDDRQHGGLKTRAYLVADRLGITRFTHERWFPRQQTVERIAHYLDRACPDWRGAIRDCYFGHTHLPFSEHHHDGVTFHNTGSAIRGLDFNPMTFAANPSAAETVSLSIAHERAA
jgi:UDP-2,3-diacylglucosamine pyrophosphatase LpxH